VFHVGYWLRVLVMKVEQSAFPLLAAFAQFYSSLAIFAAPPCICPIMVMVSPVIRLKRRFHSFVHFCRHVILRHRPAIIKVCAALTKPYLALAQVAAGLGVCPFVLVGHVSGCLMSGNATCSYNRGYELVRPYWP
jgi:hypothetical protein